MQPPKFVSPLLLCMMVPNTFFPPTHQTKIFQEKRFNKLILLNVHVND